MEGLNKLSTTENITQNKMSRTKHQNIEGQKVEKRSYSKSRYCIGRKGLSNVTYCHGKREWRKSNI